MKRLIAIGDVHGCYIQLMRLMEKINFNPKDDKLVFVGDYIDRGKDSKAVLDYLVKLRKEYPKQIVLLLGNHEQMAIDAVMNGYGSNEWRLWERNGGETTVKSFRQGCGRHDEDGMNGFFNDFIPTLNPYHVVGDFVFTHAGIPPKTDIKNAQLDDILWLRDYEAYERTKEDYLGKTIVVGHTPVKGGVCVADAIINVDTCCFHTGILSAYDVLNRVEYNSEPLV